MAIQVDNGELYLARYRGPAARTAGGDRRRVEIRDGSQADLLLDITWEKFKEIVRLGRVLEARCRKIYDRD